MAFPVMTLGGKALFAGREGQNGKGIRGERKRDPR